MKHRNDLSADRVQSILNYNQETGEFSWKSTRHNRVKVGQIAGYCDNTGKDYYIKIVINGKNYLAHRLAWLLMTGEWPKNQIDHINGIKNDNRWCNLREATNGQNQTNSGLMKNNKTGIKGVCWNKASKKYQSYIRVEGTLIHLGFYKNIEDAKVARKSAELKYFGDFI